MFFTADAYDRPKRLVLILPLAVLALSPVLILAAPVAAISVTTPNTAPALQMIVAVPPFNATLDQLLTPVTSPALNGTIARPTATIVITINGQQYTGHNNGNGTWSLPMGTLSPALRPGTYDATLTETDGTETTTTTVPQAITVDSSAPSGSFTPVQLTDASPALQGTVSQPDVTIELTVASVTYYPTNNGDGTWSLPAGTITPTLSVGAYDVLFVLRSPDAHVSSQTVRAAITIIAPTPPVATPQAYPVNPDDFEPLPLLSTDPPQLVDPALDLTLTIQPPTTITPSASQLANTNTSSSLAVDSEPLSLPKIGKQIAKHVSDASPNTVATTVTSTGIALVGTPWALLTWRRRRKKNTQTSYLS